MVFNFFYNQYTNKQYIKTTSTVKIHVNMLAIYYNINTLTIKHIQQQ